MRHTASYSVVLDYPGTEAWARFVISTATRFGSTALRRATSRTICPAPRSEASGTSLSAERAPG